MTCSQCGHRNVINFLTCELCGAALSPGRARRVSAADAYQAPTERKVNAVCEK